MISLCEKCYRPEGACICNTPIMKEDIILDWGLFIETLLSDWLDEPEELEDGTFLWEMGCGDENGTP